MNTYAHATDVGVCFVTIWILVDFKVIFFITHMWCLVFRFPVSTYLSVPRQGTLAMKVVNVFGSTYKQYYSARHFK